MDLSTIEGLTEQQQQAILSLHETDVTGLKSKNSELLGKVTDSKTVAQENERIVEEARQAAVKAKQDLLESQGKYDEAKKVGEDELATLTAQLQTEANTAKDLLKQRDIGDVRNDILAKVHDNFSPAAAAMLREAMEVEYSEEGKPTVSIRLGEAKLNKTDFLKQAETDPTWAAMLKAPDTQGTGANGSQGAQGGDGAKETVQSRLTERLKQSGIM